MAEKKARAGLLNSLRAAVREGTYSDFTIRCGPDEYHVHKVIICPRSKYFEKAVKFGKEAEEGKITLTDDHPSLVKCMVQFFYEATYEVSKIENAEELVIQALGPDSHAPPSLLLSLQSGQNSKAAPTSSPSFGGPSFKPATAATTNQQPATQNTADTSPYAALHNSPPTGPAAPFTASSGRFPPAGSAQSPFSPATTNSQSSSQSQRPATSPFAPNPPFAQQASNETSAPTSGKSPLFGGVNNTSLKCFHGFAGSCPNRNSVWSTERAEALVIHAEMYALADKYDIPSLKDLAAEKYKDAVHYHWNSNYFPISIFVAFTTTPDNDKGLRRIVLDTLATQISLVSKATTKDILRDFTGLALSLLERKGKDSAERLFLKILLAGWLKEKDVKKLSR